MDMSNPISNDINSDDISHFNPETDNVYMNSDTSSMEMIPDKINGTEVDPWATEIDIHKKHPTIPQEIIKERIDNFLKSVLVLDTETTGIDPDVDDIIEYSNSIFDDNNEISNLTARFKNTVPIPAIASSVHFITEEDLINEPTYKDSVDIIEGMFGITKYYVGHNVVFDRTMLDANHRRHAGYVFEPFSNDKKWICTLRMAKKLFAQNADYSNLTLSFLWFKLELNKECTKTIIPHSAEDDVYMCARVLEKMIHILANYEAFDIMAPDLGKEIKEFIEEPILYLYMPFGKHKGLKMSDVPADYLRWMLMNSDILDESNTTYDKDIAHTIVEEYDSRRFK